MDTSITKKVRLPVAFFLLIVMILINVYHIAMNYNGAKRYSEERNYYEQKYEETETELAEKQEKYDNSISVSARSRYRTEIRELKEELNDKRAEIVSLDEVTPNYTYRIIIFIVTVIFQICLAFFLYKKENNIFLCASLALLTLCEILRFNISSFLGLILWLIGILTYASALFVALTYCNYDRVKDFFSLNLGKLKEFFERFSKYSGWLIYIPGALKTIGFLIWRVQQPDYLSVFLDIYLYQYIIEIVFFMSITKWFIDPYSAYETKPSEAASDDTVSIGSGDLNCSMIKHILLLLFTFGIWNYIWIYRTTKFLNKTPGEKYNNPTTTLLLCMFVPFYQIFWLYSQGQRIDIFSKSKKINNADISSTCLLLGFFSPMIAFVLMQDRINALCMSSESNTAASETTSKAAEINVDQLKKCKELFDTGIITPEEFDAKKKQLLGL